SKSPYDHTIAIIQEAEDYLTKQQRGKRVFGDLVVQPIADAERTVILEQVLPVIRGAVSKRRHAILQVDTSPEALDYVGSARTGEVSQQGAACPDYLVHVKRQPLFVDWQPGDGAEALANRIRSG